MVNKELVDKYGVLPSYDDNSIRIYIEEGVVLNSSPIVYLNEGDGDVMYVVFCFDPSSPFGEMICRHVVPIVLPKDFHFNNTACWIYMTSSGDFRCELRVKTETRFDFSMANQEPKEIEEVYGFQAKPDTIAGLQRWPNS